MLLGLFSAPTLDITTNGVQKLLQGLHTPRPHSYTHPDIMCLHCHRPPGRLHTIAFIHLIARWLPSSKQEYFSMVWVPCTYKNIDKRERIHIKAVELNTYNYSRASGITTRIEQQIHMDFLNKCRQAHRFRFMYKNGKNSL